MGDMLSQDEINALLGVVDGDDGETKGDVEEAEKSELDTQSAAIKEEKLSSEEKDILGEVGNISMGTSATTLYAIVGNKVQITTPSVFETSWENISSKYNRPCVGIKVNYKVGLQGSNVLLLKEKDVRIIANLMMGGDGNVPNEAELSEIDLSAISEAMNQMIGSSATSLSSMMNYMIDIDTPDAFVVDFTDAEFADRLGFSNEEEIVMVSFRMVVGDLIDSQIMQIFSIRFAKEIVNALKNQIAVSGEDMEENNINDAVKEESFTKEKDENIEEIKVEQKKEGPAKRRTSDTSKEYTKPNHNINASKAMFNSFEDEELVIQKENIDIIMDVPLEVTVELGRTKKRIKEILEFTPGTIIELEKIAGEPIDILVNGKFVARGEVVVIDENFGIRIIDILNVEDRI